MNISINEESPIPVYRQIIIEVLNGVIKHVLGHSTSLPTIRQLAADLSLTNTTVAKAYQILEQRKIIATAGRRGTFIHESAEENASKYLLEELQGQMRDLISMQLKCGASIDDIQKSLHLVLKEFTERNEK